MYYAYCIITHAGILFTYNSVICIHDCRFVCECVCVFVCECVCVWLSASLHMYYIRYNLSGFT